ncbi:hypothetical protein ACS0TY_020444 [Phlomoides rotata]
MTMIRSKKRRERGVNLVPCKDALVTMAMQILKVKGLGQPATVPALCELVKARRPDVLTIQIIFFGDSVKLLEIVIFLMLYSLVVSILGLEDVGLHIWWKKDWIELCVPHLLNLVAPISDHNPILLKAKTTPVHCKHRRFKFENMWLLERDLLTVVRRSWAGFSDLDILSRLNATLDTLILWGRHRDTAFIENKEIDQEIESLQKFTDPTSCSRYSALRRNLAEMLVREETYWRQKGKHILVESVILTINSFIVWLRRVVRVEMLKEFMTF